jgi:hypothetical protein
MKWGKLSADVAGVRVQPRANVMDQSPGPPSDSEHVAFARLVRYSALELILTFFMLFGVTSIVRWVIGPSLISRTIPQIQVELLMVGASVALLIAGLILSPPGRATGCHMNPAISLAMWRFGVFPGAGVMPYIVAQLLGSVLGVLGARAVWGPVVAQPPVAYAVLQRAAWHVHRGQREPSPPVWPGPPFRPDALTMGVSAGSADRDMASPDDSASPGRLNPQIVRHPSRRTPVKTLFVWREDTADGLYDTPGFLVLPGSVNSRRYVGASPQVLITQQLGRHSSVSLNYYHFYRGGFLTSQTRTKDVDYFSIWISYTF